VPPRIFLSQTGDPTQFQAGSGVMVLTNTDSSGAGAFSPINTPAVLTASNNLAVYEILWANPNWLEFAEVPYTLINAPQSTPLQISVVFAPFYADSASGQASNSAPVPRFENRVCDPANCIQISPVQNPNTGISTVTFTANFNMVGAQVKLTSPGLPDIQG